MFSVKENHLAQEGRADRPNLRFFDPWERKLAFDQDHNDRMAPTLSGENRVRTNSDDR